jgi:hypothetical protein
LNIALKKMFNVQVGIGIEIGIEIERLDATADGKLFVFSIPIPIAIPTSMIPMDNGRWTFFGIMASRHPGILASCAFRVTYSLKSSGWAIIAYKRLKTWTQNK